MSAWRFVYWASIGALFIASALKPVSPGVAAFVQPFLLFGFVMIGLLAAVQWVVAIVRLEPFAWRDLLLRVESACVALVIVASASRLIGDDIWAAAVSQPVPAAAFACALALAAFWLLPRDAPSAGAAAPLGIGEIGSTVDDGAAPLTERDRRHVAAHECGHALMYAALGRLPPGAEAVFVERPAAHAPLGFVRAIESTDRIGHAAFALWEMHVLLAGREAEIHLEGTASLGAAVDHRRWLSLARHYLESECDGVYFSEPQNSFENESNESKLIALRARQFGVIRALFTLNADVLLEMRDALLATGRLDREALVPFLARVRLPQEFPLPLGAFDAFETQWPESRSQPASA